MVSPLPTIKGILCDRLIHLGFATQEDEMAEIVAPVSKKAKMGTPKTVAGKEYFLALPLSTEMASIFLFLEPGSSAIFWGDLWKLGAFGFRPDRFSKGFPPKFLFYLDT